MNSNTRTPQSEVSQTTPERADNRQTLIPLVDVFENADELLLKVDMPGVTLDDVTIRLDRNQLSLEGVVREKAELVFSRQFVVPTSIEAEKIGAELKAGILTVHLPKRSQAKPRTVTVNAA